MCVKDCTGVANVKKVIGNGIDSCNCNIGLKWNKGASSCGKDCSGMENVSGDVG